MIFSAAVAVECLPAGSAAGSVPHHDAAVDIPTGMGLGGGGIEGRDAVCPSWPLMQCFCYQGSGCLFFIHIPANMHV